MKFGERLKLLRESNNLTQDEFARIINKSRSSLAGYEVNDRVPDIDTIINISNYFGVTTDYLLGKSEYKTSGEEAFFLKYFNIDDNFKNLPVRDKQDTIATLKLVYGNLLLYSDLQHEMTFDIARKIFYSVCAYLDLILDTKEAIEEDTWKLNLLEFEKIKTSINEYLTMLITSIMVEIGKSDLQKLENHIEKPRK
jgi:transcriptional regulator with XRE-family HTH domain